MAMGIEESCEIDLEDLITLRGEALVWDDEDYEWDHR
jgi:hypothetical protein